MNKLENNSLQIFLDRFIEELKEEGKRQRAEFDIPFIISSLTQSFQNNPEKYYQFAKDLDVYSDYTITILNSQNDYNGIIDVQINLVKYIFKDGSMYEDQKHPEHIYELCFTYDTRDYGYCECTPDMPDYREDKHCCGHGCDAVFCEFSLHKVLQIASGSWDGDEHDYWDFEDEFYLRNKELAEKKEKEDREREIEELKRRIEADQKRLAKLECINETN